MKTNFESNNYYPQNSEVYRCEQCPSSHLREHPQLGLHARECSHSLRLSRSRTRSLGLLSVASAQVALTKPADS